MALETKTYPYEILIRFNEGGFQGAYRKDVTHVVDGETGRDVVPPSVSAVPLDVPHAHLPGVLNETHLRIVTENAALKARVASLEARLSDHHRIVAERDMWREAHDGQLARLRDESAAHGAVVERLEEELRRERGRSVFDRLRNTVVSGRGTSDQAG